MSDQDSTWPEQNAIDAWFKEHGLDQFPHSAMMELKKAVTQPRLNVQDRIATLEAQLEAPRKALKSFALAHKVHRQDTETLRQFESGLNNGDLRRAKEAYEERG